MTSRAMRIMRSATIALMLPVATGAQGVRTFPHERHARLFPSCLGCHDGVMADEPSRAMPGATLCAGCHDGKTRRLVEWKPATARGASLLAFSHAKHAKVAADDGLLCASCHAVGDSAEWMLVARAAPERCLGCHAHDAGGAHLAEANTCSACHRTLAAAGGLSEQKVATLPRPPSHDAPNFLSMHGAATKGGTAMCATCHARESCARCHVDAGRSAVIGALGSDARVSRLAARKAAAYPSPADHQRKEFATEHGSVATGNPARCATCHARASCTTCHTGNGARDVIDRLPGEKEARGRGVQLRRSSVSAAADQARSVPRQKPAAMAGAPLRATETSVQVHPSGFGRTHGAAAASGGAKCASCHAQRECSDCHAGERSRRRFHVANFVSRHAPESYSRETECNSCHSTETFCRDCHRQTGLAAGAGSRSGRYHNAESVWLLQHGRAARQDLTSCTSCHAQTYCMQCHSGAGWRINPHGPDFDAARMQQRNPSTCMRCHLTEPLAGK